MRDRSSFRGGVSYRRNALIIGAMLFVALVAFLLDTQGVLTPVRAYLTNSLTPLVSSVYGVNLRASDLLAGSQDLQRVTQERDTLLKENSDLKAQILRIPQIEIENMRLREQLRIEKTHPWQLIGADVSVQTLADGRRIVLIGVGSSSGVKVGMAVISRYQSSPPALVGVISVVNVDSASMTLIDDYSSVISVQAYHGTAVVRGILQGSIQQNGMLQMSEIEREAEVADGDSVVTAGLTRLYGPSLPNAAIPADIPIGIVKSTRIDGRSKVVDVQPYINPELVHYVWIIHNDTK
ncbi:MAG: rod shape-determining protein MreC [Chloroflexi bacterium]|jgi:rod shape-determining protein MreC|nr:MAG: rod shape-determining protein MreC [Chloroflexota bacterium]